MRVLFLHHPLDYSFEAYLQGVTELLVGLGHDVRVLVLGRKGHLSDLFDPAVRVYERPVGALAYHDRIHPRLRSARRLLGFRPACPMSSPLLRVGAAAAYLLAFLSIREAFDVVVAPEHRAGGLWIRRLRQQPLVTVVHGPVSILAPFWGFSPAGLPMRISARLEARSLRDSSAAVIPSELFKTRLTEAGWPLPRRTFVVPHVLSRRGAPPCLPADACERHVMVVGSVGCLKGSDVVIRAAALLRQARVVVRFLGADEPAPSWRSKVADAKRLAAELGVRCEFLGWRTRNEVMDAYATARVVVVASRLESFSLAALEAAHAGRPVVISSGAGAAELRGRGAPFCVFPSEDAAVLAGLLEPLLSDPREARRLGSNAKLFIEGEDYRRSARDGWVSVLDAATAGG